jgi:putative PIN family toxin of toxin-antitoxin system
VKVVIDTDVVVAGVRSPNGASAALLSEVLEGGASILLTVALVLEYEEVCMRLEHRQAANATEADIHNIMDVIVDVGVPVEVHYQWRPQLSDAADEMVLEAAVNGQADAIITFNSAHFGGAPAQFGIEVLTPREAIKRIRE